MTPEENFINWAKRWVYQVPKSTLDIFFHVMRTHPERNIFAHSKKVTMNDFAQTALSEAKSLDMRACRNYYNEEWDLCRLEGLVKQFELAALRVRTYFEAMKKEMKG